MKFTGKFIVWIESQTVFDSLSFGVREWCTFRQALCVGISGDVSVSLRYCQSGSNQRVVSMERARHRPDRTIRLISLSALCDLLDMEKNLLFLEEALFLSASIRLQCSTAFLELQPFAWRIIHYKLCKPLLAVVNSGIRETERSPAGVWHFAQFKILFWK